MSQNLLEVRDLSVRFETPEGSVQAVDGVSFAARRGQTTCIVGESGCGKSVTALAVMGLLDRGARVTGGQVLLEGEDLLQKTPGELRAIRGSRVSMVFQEPMTSLHPLYTVGWQVEEVYRSHTDLSPRLRRQKTLEILGRVGIREPEACARQYPHQLSGGMRQRVMIAMALAMAPGLLLADEPTTALDVTIQAQVLDLMKDLKREAGTSIILITHDMGVVADMADRVLVMYLGRIVEEADVLELFARPLHPYTQGLLESVPPLYKDVEDLPAIGGTVPLPGEIPEGCPFAPRCAYACGRCHTWTPRLVRVGQGRRTACLRAGELTLKGVEEP